MLKDKRKLKDVKGQKARGDARIYRQKNKVGRREKLTDTNEQVKEDSRATPNFPPSSQL